MKKLLFFIADRFAVSCSNDCDELELEVKVTLEGGNGDIPIEVRLYEYGSGSLILHCLLLQK
jgi:hypothetical protein